MAGKFFDHEQFNFELQCALGGVHNGAGDVGEMLSTASRVVDGDADSWCQEWITTAQRLATVAEGCNRHCEPMARSLLEQSMFDWLDETLPAATS